MKSIIRLPLDIVLWLMFFAVHSVLWVIGFPLCFVMALSGQYELGYSRFFMDAEDPTKQKRILVWKSRWMLLFGNEEDGVGGPSWWDARIKGELSWKEVFLWSAWRNPVNNLRFVPVIHPVPDPQRVGYAGNSLDPSADLNARRYEGSDRRTPFWCYAWQGVFAGFWIIWPFASTRHFRFRLGWKILPRDAVRGVVDDYRRFRYPFGIQLTPWRKG
jgi:hypothetical protein